MCSLITLLKALNWNQTVIFHQALSYAAQSSTFSLWTENLSPVKHVAFREENRNTEREFQAELT